MYLNLINIKLRKAALKKKEGCMNYIRRQIERGHVKGLSAEIHPTVEAIGETRLIPQYYEVNLSYCFYQNLY